MLEKKIRGKYIWLVDDKSKILNYKEKAKKYMGVSSEKIIFVRKKSILGLFHYLTANYKFSTHGTFEQLPLLPFQKKINLWHGMPLKTIGHLSGNPIKLKMDYTLSTAPIFNGILSEAFQIEQQKVLSIGLPRNDLFFKKTTFSLKDIVGEDSSKVIVWFPTYRKSIEGDIRIDGDFKENVIGNFTYEELDNLDRELVENKVKLLIKLHPMDYLNDTTISKEFSNIIILKRKEYEDLLIEVNDFLKDSDALVTDYSSVYFDYVLTGKPIGLISGDSEEYASTRGFISEDIYNNFTGYKIDNVQDFIDFTNQLDELSSADKQCVFEKYDQSGFNGEALLKKIGIL